MTWKSSFDTVSQIGQSSRFDTYQAKENRHEYFIKATNDNTDSWSRMSIDKEYEVYKALDLNKFHVPDVHMYRESELLGVEWIDSNNWKNLNRDDDVISVIGSFRSLVESLSNHDNLELNNRWPNTEEFHHRLNATVSFNETGYSELKPILNKAKGELKSIQVPESDKSLIHGDIFYPNILFRSDGAVKSIIDWEIAGYFDQMYDVGFIESNVLDILSLYDNSFDHDEILSMFRDELGLTQSQIERVRLYKLWPHYVKLASIEVDSHNSDYYPNHSNPEREVLKLFNSSVEKTRYL